MVDPIPPYLSPQRLKRLEQLADAVRLRAALYPSPKPPRSSTPSGHPVPELRNGPELMAPAGRRQVYARLTQGGARPVTTVCGV